MPLISFVALLWTCVVMAMSFWCWGPQSWIHYSRQGFTTADERGRVVSCDLMGPGYSWLSGVQVHAAGLGSAFCPAVDASPFPQYSSQSIHLTVCSDGVLPIPGARPCTSPCFNFEIFKPVDVILSGWYSFLLVQKVQWSAQYCFYHEDVIRKILNSAGFSINPGGKPLMIGFCGHRSVTLCTGI